jgi:hypothetical protein
LILNKIPSHYYARMICTPTFGKPQWAIAVFKDEMSKFFVEYFEAKERIGPEKESRDIKVERIKVEIDKESADAVEAVWYRMLRGVRYPDEKRFGDDGHSYDFSRNMPGSPFDGPGGPQEGWIWSPDDESPTGRLVAIGEKLREYALARPEGRAGIRVEIRRKAEQLKADLGRPDRKN